MTPAKTTTRASKPAAKKAAPPAKKTAATPKVRKTGWHTDSDQPLISRYWNGDSWYGAGLPTRLVTAKTPAPTDEQISEDVIVFRDRAMRVKRPTPEQAAVWQRIYIKLSKRKPTEVMSGEETAQTYDRGQRVVAGLLADDDDKEWLTDEFLDGLSLQEAANIVTMSVDAFGAKVQTQRQAAPRTGPVTRRR